MKTIAIASLIIPLVACGELQSPRDYRGPALASIDASVQGSLDQPAGPVRGALIWSVYDAALVDCLAAVPDFVAPLDFDDEANWPIIDALAVCAFVHDSSRVETSSLELETTFPSTFSLPVFDLPAEELLTGPPGARMGIAAVDLYVDGNDNGALDLAPPGTDGWPDSVVGTSGRLSSRTLAAFVVYREGELSPLWKLISGIYGCPEEPAVGFSSMHVDVLSDEYGIIDSSCVVDDAPVDVFLEDSLEMRREVCAPDPSLSGYNRIEPGDVLDPDTAFVCEADFTVYYSHDPDLLCPIFGRYDLIGCTDRTSQASCAQTFFDDFDNAPAWWPCANLWVYGSTVVEPATDELDTVARFGIHNGVLSLTGLQAEAELPGGDLSRAFVVTLVDNDGNGFANEGDQLLVSEANDLFNTSTPVGGYEIRLLSGGTEIASTYFYPQQVSYPELELDIIDATPAETAATGAAFFIDAVAGNGAHPLDLLAVNVAYSCEAGVIVRSPDLALTDVDQDGLFGVGDRLEVRLQDDGWGFPSGYDCITLAVEPGPNVSVGIGYGEWVVISGVTAEAIPGPHTDALDDLLLITIGACGETISWSEEIFASLSLRRNNQFIDSISADVVVLDHDGDGLVSAGDQLILSEAEETFNADTPATEASFGVSIGRFHIWAYEQVTL